MHVSSIWDIRDSTSDIRDWNLSMSCRIKLTSMDTVSILAISVSFSEVIAAIRSADEGSASPMLVEAV